MKVSLSPGIPWSAWTKHICLAARKKMTGHQSWKGHRFLCVFFCVFLFFKTCKINMGTHVHLCIYDRFEEGWAYRAQFPTLTSSKTPLSTSISFTFWIWNYLLFEIHEYKALSTEVVGFHPLYKSIESFLKWNDVCAYLFFSRQTMIKSLLGCQRDMITHFKERKKVKSLSHVWLFATTWTVTHQTPPSMGFSRQQYWSGFPFSSPGDLPNPGLEIRSPTLQADAFTVWATRDKPSTSKRA